MASCWWVDSAFKFIFPQLGTAFSIEGEQITQSPLSRLFKVNLNNKHYYIKRYYRAGRHLRKWIARSRMRAEWENLLFFQSLGIPIPRVIAYGEERRLGAFQRGVLITEELPNTVDLADYAQNNQEKLRNYTWRNMIIDQVANYTHLLHNKKFIHNDLKWRNILIEQGEYPKIYFIDCPIGRRRYSFLFTRGAIKDLACLDKKAKYHLSKTARLRFYCQYRQIKSLSAGHKQEIKKILAFHEGRE